MAAAGPGGVTRERDGAPIGMTAVGGACTDSVSVVVLSDAREEEGAGPAGWQSVAWRRLMRLRRAVRKRLGECMMIDC